MSSMWMVTEGIYSDYRLLCICPTEEDAEAVKAKRIKDKMYDDDVRVEEVAVVTADIEKVDVLRFATVLWDNGTESVKLDGEAHTKWPFDLYDTPACRWRWVRAPIYKNSGGRLEVWEQTTSGSARSTATAVR